MTYFIVLTILYNTLCLIFFKSSNAYIEYSNLLGLGFGVIALYIYLSTPSVQ